MGVVVRGPDNWGHDIWWRDELGEFRLHMFKSITQDEPDRTRWGYVFWDSAFKSDPMFSGSDYTVPKMTSDPREIVAGLLDFLSLRPGDTDREYFDSYTQEQKDWVEERAEDLTIHVEKIKRGAIIPGGMVVQ